MRLPWQGAGLVLSLKRAAERLAASFRESAAMAEDHATSTVMLARPAEGETARVAIQADCVYRLGFEPGDSTWSNNGRDVLVHFDNGSNLVLQNFLPAAEGGGLYLEMPDGAVVLGKDLVDALARSLEDFRPSGGWAFLDEGHDEAGLFFAAAPSPEGGSEAGPKANPPEPYGHAPAFFAHHGEAGLPVLDDLLDVSPTLFPGRGVHPPGSPPTHSAPPLTPDAPHVAGENLPANAPAAHSPVFADSTAPALEDGPDHHLLAQLFLLSL